MKKAKITNFDDSVIADFKKNPKALTSFKDFVIKQYKKDKDFEVFKESLKLIIKAERGTATKIANNAHIDRTGIYKALSPKINPRIDTFKTILNGAGFDIDIVKLQKV
jgi:DNA-binding phage protein